MLSLSIWKYIHVDICSTYHSIIVLVKLSIIVLKIRINKLILFYKQFKNNTALASSNMIKVLFEVMKWIKYSYIRNVKLSTNQSINQSINRSINFKLNQVSKLKYEDYRLWISKLSSFATKMQMTSSNLVKLLLKCVFPVTLSNAFKV